jgi:hypothetical protein
MRELMLSSSIFEKWCFKKQRDFMLSSNTTFLEKSLDEGVHAFFKHLQEIGVLISTRESSCFY